MTLQRLLEMYREGSITNSEFVSDLLALLDEDNADRVLGLVPPEVADDLARVVMSYDPSATFISFGGAPIPSSVQIELARRWLKDRNGGENQARPASRSGAERMDKSASKLIAAFGTPTPVFAELPHLIMEFIDSTLDTIGEVTGAKPAPWPCPPRFDEMGRDTAWDERVPFGNWGLELNQKELRLNAVTGQLFMSNEYVLVDSASDPDLIKDTLPQDGGSRIRTLQQTDRVVAKLKWVAVPLLPDTDLLLFVTNQEYGSFAEGLRTALIRKRLWHAQLRLEEGVISWHGYGGRISAGLEAWRD